MAEFIDNISELVQVKADMKAALIYKNSEPEGGMRTYAEAIRKISGEVDTASSCTITFPDSIAVDVIKGGVNITDDIVVNGVATVDKVDEPLNVNVLELRSVTYIIRDHAYLSNMISKIPLTHTYEADLTFDYGYEADEVIVMVNGVNVTSTTYKDNKINITNVDGDISISVSAKIKYYNIEYNLDLTTSSNTVNKINEGGAYNTTLIVPQYFEITTINVVMNGEDVTDTVYSNGTISIADVTGDIVITAKATNIVYTVTYNLENATSTNTSVDVLAGKSYSTLLTKNSTCTDIEVSVTMNDEDWTNINIENGIVLIDTVIGDIIINARGYVIELEQYQTLEHYTKVDIDDIKIGQSLDVMLVSARKENGYVLGIDNDQEVKYGNGFDNMILLQHKAADVANDQKFQLTLSKHQDTRTEDVYGDVLQHFEASGTVHNINVVKIQSSISGYDLYSFSGNLSIERNVTRTGRISITFTGKTFPQTIYGKVYAQSGSGKMTLNGSTVVTQSTNNTVTSLSNFSPITVTSNMSNIDVELGPHTYVLGSRNFRIWFAVPVDTTVNEKIGEETYNVGDPYFKLTSKTTGLHANNDDSGVSTWTNEPNENKFSLITPISISDSNISTGTFEQNNPCIFRFKNQNDKYLTASDILSPTYYSATESADNIWYLYKPNTAGWSTEYVSITKHLNRSTLTNPVNSVKYGESYESDITFDTGTVLIEFIVTMHGHDITSAVLSNNHINIPYVTGPIDISVLYVNEDDVRHLTYELTDVWGITSKTGYFPQLSNDSFDAILDGRKYSAVVSFDSTESHTLSANNYNITVSPAENKYMKVVDCVVIMQGVEYTDMFDYNTQTLTIPNTQGDITVRMAGAKIVGYVDNTYYDSDSSDNHIMIDSDALPGAGYNAKFDAFGSTVPGFDTVITTF